MEGGRDMSGHKLWHLVLPAGLLVALALVDSVSSIQQTPTITLKKAKLADLNEYVKNQKGKVVVLDCWHYLCDPCKKEFPNLIKLHKQYGGKVACVSVSVGLEPEKFYDKSLKFLEKQGAAFANFMLPESETEPAQTQFKMVAVPAVFVIDAQGKTVAECRDGFYYENGKKIEETQDEGLYQRVSKVVDKLVK